MKILNIMQCTNLGGMEQASLRLMAGLQHRGHTCRVLSLNPLGALAPLLVGQGIAAQGLPYAGKGGWRSFPALRRALRGAQADALVMTGHNLLAMLALGGVARSQRVLAMHFHHTGVKPAWQWRLIYRLACRRFQAVTFPSDFVRKEAEALYPALASISQTVRNPIPLPDLPSAADRLTAREKLGLPGAALIVGNAGWLIGRKRFDVFLQVARRVIEQVPGAIFLIAGDGPEKDSLQLLARELGISGNVRWLGWQQDLGAFYHSLDLLLFNSDWDAMGLTPLEAMSYGIPVVASVVNGGLREVINSAEVGFLLPVHDLQSLAQQTVSLLQGAERRTVGLRGRSRIAEIGSPEACAASYQELLSGMRAPGRKEQPVAAAPGMGPGR
jgi:glycosyltransferase involved in cell wall biosynthesis